MLLNRELEEADNPALNLLINNSWICEVDINGWSLRYDSTSPWYT